MSIIHIDGETPISDYDEGDTLRLEVGEFREIPELTPAERGSTREHSLVLTERAAERLYFSLGAWLTDLAVARRMIRHVAIDALPVSPERSA